MTLSSAKPHSFTVYPINDCAALVASYDNSIQIVTADGVAQFAMSDADLATAGTMGAPWLIPTPSGFWEAHTVIGADTPLSFVRPGDTLTVDLPADADHIDAAVPDGDRVLVAVESITGASLLSIAQDGTVTTLWTTSEEIVGSIAVDDSGIVIAVGAGSVDDAMSAGAVVVDNGQGWVRTDLGAGIDYSRVAMDSDTIVILSASLDADGDQGSVVTDVSHDRGVTWTRQAATDYVDYDLLGFHAGHAIAQFSRQDSSSGVFELDDNDAWTPVDSFATEPPGGAADLSLAGCGLWTLDYDTDVLSYTPFADC
jgi:hypothetical protein